MLLRMALFFLNYPVRISQKSCRATLGALKASGYPFAVKIFTDLGHGGLAGEHPEQFVQEVSAAHGKSLAGKGEEK